MSSDAFVVRRRVMLAHPLAAGDLDAALAAVRALPGMREAAAERDRRSLRVHYDASQLSYGQIRGLLNANGYPPATDLWSRIKASACSYLDDNARANAGSNSSPCCSNPVEIHASRRSKRG